MKTFFIALALAASSLVLTGCGEKHHPNDGHDHGSEHHEGDGHKH